MKRPFLLTLIGIFLLPFTLFAANPTLTITGTLIDSTSLQPVGFASVVLMRDSTVATAIAADAQGVFTLKPKAKGHYTLQVSLVGYTTHSQAVEVKSTNTDLGKIALSQGVEISDVVVSVQKPLVISDAEKLTYSVEDDPQAASSTLEEIIRKVPQLSLDADGNVLLNGQSNYKILLNGHQATTLSNNFKEIIKSMPASQIRKIEVITNPSTKYDAEGAGGIINLITEKKNKMDGYNGSVTAGLSLLSQVYGYGSANVSMQRGKFAAGVGANYGQWKTGNQPSTTDSWQENYNAPNRYQNSHSENKYNGRNTSFYLDLSYQPDTLNLITLNGWIWNGRNSQATDSTTDIFDPTHTPISQYNNNNNRKDDYTGGSIAFNYEHTFGKTGHTLTLSDEVEIDPYRSDYYNTIEGTLNFPSYGNWQHSTDRGVNNTVQLDYVNPLTEHHNIEAGLKHIYRNSSSTTRLQTSDVDGNYMDDATRYDGIKYRQNILALYAGYGFTFTKWTGRVGARMERTWNTVAVTNSLIEPYSFVNKQINLIPYLSLTFAPKQGHSISFSYTERIERPNIWSLTPSIDDTDPTSVSYGNPHLKAALFHSLNLQYNYFSSKWSTSFALTSFLSNNYISNYTFVDDKGITNYTYSNDVHTRAYGFNGSFSYRPSSKLNISFSYRGNYAKYDFDAMGIHSDQFSFSENLNLDFAVWKDARIMLGESYKTGDLSLGSKTNGYYYYYIGVKQQFFKKKLDISVSISNLFDNNKEYKADYDTPTYRGGNIYRSPARQVSFRLAFRFGKQNVSVKRTARSIENDDMGGGGGSKGSGGGGK
ncbi:MAG: TonB-dependent receptor [Alistipes sp.]